nr:heparan-alpha-glucosaminide N-acetyltransferase [Azospirillum doebereinerae]
MTDRRPALDAARGVALVAMAVYHGCWDLTFHGLASFDLLGDPLWLTARTLILSSFLLLAGVSLVLATGGGLDAKRFLSRLARLAAAAGAVSAASYILFPDSPIFFGVLHHMAAASVIGLAFVRLPAALTLAAAVAAVLAGEHLAVPAFDSPWLRWIGLTTVPPNSNDFVPLLPWIGGVLAGIGLARLWPGIGTGPSAPNLLTRALAWAGRHSLAVYLIHQPLLFGLFWLVAQGVGMDTPQARNFHASCVASCTQTGAEAGLCDSNCLCVRTELTKAGLWDRFIANRLDDQGRRRVGDAVLACGPQR